MYDFQKANMWKRISAWLFDFILIGIVIVGIAAALSVAFRYDVHYARLEASYDKYEEKYGIDLNISAEDRDKLSEEELQKYEAAGKEMQKDAQIRGCYTVVVNLVLMITALSIMLGYFIMEFIIPLCFIFNSSRWSKVIG